jgi:hypothetical protein
MQQQQQMLTHTVTAHQQQGPRAGQAGTSVQAAGAGRLVTQQLLLVVRLAQKQRRVGQDPLLLVVVAVLLVVAVWVC